MHQCSSFSSRGSKHPFQNSSLYNLLLWKSQYRRSPGKFIKTNVWNLQALFLKIGHSSMCTQTCSSKEIFQRHIWQAFPSVLHLMKIFCFVDLGSTVLALNTSLDLYSTNRIFSFWISGNTLCRQEFLTSPATPTFDKCAWSHWDVQKWSLLLLNLDIGS